MYITEAASLEITKEVEIIKETEKIIEEVHKGDIYYAIYIYEAEAGQAIDMVEGEKVYVIEAHSTDWWFVKKHLTDESGWVPAQILMEEEKYIEYVQKKLNEKIDKLPILESK